MKNIGGCGICKKSLLQSGLGPNIHFGINPIQIQLSQIKYIAFLDFNTNTNFLIQIHCHFLFTYDSNTLPFLKFDSNTIQIRALLGERHIKVAINGCFEG